jgi:hypothetical protein
VKAKTKHSIFIHDRDKLIFEEIQNKSGIGKANLFGLMVTHFDSCITKNPNTIGELISLRMDKITSQEAVKEKAVKQIWEA